MTSCVLEEDYVVVDQEGIAIVVQDELQNTYQLAVLVESNAASHDLDAARRLWEVSVDLTRVDPGL